jgi:hypothetical protein
MEHNDIIPTDELTGDALMQRIKSGSIALLSACSADIDYTVTLLKEVDEELTELNSSAERQQAQEDFNRIAKLLIELELEKKELMESLFNMEG